MPKRKNGGGEYKKVKGSSGKSSPKTRSAIEEAVTTMMIGMSTPLQPRSSGAQKLQEKGSPSVPFSTSMSYAPRVLEESKPLQPRQTFIQRAPDVSSNMPFRNTDIERLKELGTRFGASGASSVSQPSQRMLNPEEKEYFLKHGKLPD